MTNYIKALRLSVVFLAGLLCVVSFKANNTNGSSLLPTIFTIFLAGTCMVQNDWRDRKHDILKGKGFALNNEKMFLFFLAILWSVTITLTILLWQKQIKFGWFATVLVICGFIYSEVRKIPLLPAVLVATASASPALYPVILLHSKISLFIFLSTVFLILGREILKDLDDVNYDSGYKWTLPLSIGQKNSKIVAGIFILLASIVIISVSLKTIIGVALLFVSAIYLLANKSHGTAKSLIDIGGLLILVSLFFLGI